MSSSPFADIYERDSGRFRDQWEEVLRIPSISGDPSYHDECIKCANWLKDHLGKMGLENVGLIDTPTKPVVFAEFVKDPSARTVLFYGHYDVQPASRPWPQEGEKWLSDPFVPTERDGRLYARGSQDNKGQLMYFLNALETCMKEGALNCNVKLFIEGEEEAHSVGFSSVLPQLGAKARGDVLIVCDTDATELGNSGITMGLRGIVSLEVSIGGLSGELHSGQFGGGVENPANELVRVVSSLKNPDGSIAVKGYLDGLQPVTDAHRRILAESEATPDEFRSQTGVNPGIGEPGFSPAERMTLRPTIDVNGINGGYVGEGPKTIIPDGAFAKITSRLGAGQDPDRCLQLLVDHLTARAPANLKFEIRDAEVGGPALSLDPRSELVALASEVLSASAGKPAKLLYTGGSIPVVARFAQVSGATPLLIGHGLPEDKIHQANESFSLEQYRVGFTGLAELLSRL